MVHRRDKGCLLLYQASPIAQTNWSKWRSMQPELVVTLTLFSWYAKSNFSTIYTLSVEKFVTFLISLNKIIFRLVLCPMVKLNVIIQMILYQVSSFQIHFFTSSYAEIMHSKNQYCLESVSDKEFGPKVHVTKRSKIFADSIRPKHTSQLEAFCEESLIKTPCKLMHKSQQIG